MPVSQFQNDTVNLTHFSDEDKAVLKRGNRADERSLRHVKARKAAMNHRKAAEEKRTERNPGTGGFMRGRLIQQARLREIGKERRRAESLRTME